jgi:transposase
MLKKSSEAKNKIKSLKDFFQIKGAECPMVADHLNLNPASGQLFLFRNKTQKKLKILWWDKNGFWLFYKRLEKGKFKVCFGV